MNFLLLDHNIAKEFHKLDVGSLNVKNILGTTIHIKNDVYQIPYTEYYIDGFQETRLMTLQIHVLELTTISLKKP